MRMKPNVRPVALFSIALLVGVAALTACNSNELYGPQAASKPQNQQASGAPGTPQTPSDGARRITAEELHDLWEKDKVLIIDTRGPAAWEQSHIKGSIAIAPNDILAKADELPRDKMIVAYCT